MNRRGILKFLGISAAAVATSSSVLAEPLPSVQRGDDMWVEEYCPRMLNSEGTPLSEPSDAGVWCANNELEQLHKCVETPVIKKLIEECEERLIKKTQDYETDIREWNSALLCNAHYKRMHGTLVLCPKCGAQSFPILYPKDKGILI